MISKEFGTTYHIGHVRKIMRSFDMTKSSQPVHVNRATEATVNSWQQRLVKRILRLRNAGFRLGVFDKVFFIYNMKAGRKYWSGPGIRINVPYTGSHRKITAYGTLFFNGDRYVTTEEGKFTDDRFIAHIKDLIKKNGKTVLFVDRARQHMSKKVKQFLKNEKKIKLIYLPKSSPYLNAIEKLWDLVKREVLVGEY